ncbi:MAG TPA: dicarboxylate/amino acid:cation symporter [Polyangiaceae bacterium]
MSEQLPADSSPSAFAWWTRLPLYLRILVGLGLGVVAGAVVGPSAHVLELPARLILRLLGALAPPLILVAVVHALLTAEIRGAVAWRLARLLLLNTLTAIIVGLLVANLLAPGRHAHLTPPHEKLDSHGDLLAQFLENIPDSLLRPFVENRVIGVVLIAVAFGVAARSLSGKKRKLAEDLASLGFSCILTILSWVIAFVPLAVFGKVASIVGVSGFRPFVAIGMFVIAVLLALLIQAVYYLVRIRFGSWVRPGALLASTRDALIMAFSTGSSTVTMPVTYDRLCNRVGLRERSASLGALVGSNFNNDGTALYEAMAALFIAQMLGQHLSFFDQVLVILTSVVASVGAAGIPEAGLVTMTLVFTAVKLPVEYIALLLSVDWFLDRCRTAINVLGDMNVACLLDGPTRESADERTAASAARAALSAEPSP